MPSDLDRLIRHAERYGVEGIYDVAVDELPAVQIRGLVAQLRTIAQRRGERVRVPTSRNGHDRPDLPKSTQPPSGVIRNEMRRVGDSTPALRTCERCSTPLPSTLRADAHYCIGGACKQAAHRARRAAVFEGRS